MIWFAFLPALVWLYLLLGRGMFWLMRERDDRNENLAERANWPSVIAVVPARNEADVVGEAVASLLAQDYPGRFRVVLVDDQSTDDTSQAAQATIRQATSNHAADIVRGRERPEGWTGKLWAMKQGVEYAVSGAAPDYFLFTDADIAHSPDNLRRLIARAEGRQLVLTSLMAKLHCESVPEKVFIPAFVFFFDMLFPFRWVNDPRATTAAAAGGCMLARRDALLAAGGIDAIRNEIIDDCALARIMKSQGAIWLGLTARATSIRPYDGIRDIHGMIARSAYAQLGYSPLVLAGTIAGMAIVYCAAPLLAAFGAGTVRIAGLVAWALMVLAFQPMLRLYRLSPLWGLALPLIGTIYSLFTVDSALQFWRGRGGMWKGRAQAMA